MVMLDASDRLWNGNENTYGTLRKFQYTCRHTTNSVLEQRENEKIREKDIEEAHELF